MVESLFTNAPAGIALVRGDDQVIEFANPMALEIWGKDADVIGKPLLEALPELRGRASTICSAQVMRTGTPYVGDEVPVMFQQGRRETASTSSSCTRRRETDTARSTASRRSAST